MVRALSVIALLLFFAGLPELSVALTYTFDLSTADDFDAASSTATLNTTLGRAIPGVTADAINVDFGDGSDGAFNDGPTQPGITGGPVNFTINTDVKSEFNFTSFNLGGGNTITVVGSVPLTIKVLGNVTVVGTLSANGEDGAASSAGGAGGQGALDGGDGGIGGIGLTTALATDGTSTIGTHRDGGKFGAGGAAPSPVGGGGGCLGGAATAGQNSGVSGAAGICAKNAATTGDEFDDPSSTFAGGAGGGGGGFLTGPALDGGGGGGGGGALKLVSSGDVSSTGSVEVDGGGGGISDTGVAALNCPAGGGGGSGGALWLQSNGTITGTYSRAAGPGGAEAICGLYAGGSGGVGVQRVDGRAGSVAGDYAGVIAHVSSTFYSQPIDLSDGYYTLNSIASTIAGTTVDGTATILFEGSNDETAFDSSTAVAAANIFELSEFAYIRARVDFNVINPLLDPEYVTALSLDYELTQFNQFVLDGMPWCTALGVQSYKKSSVRGNDRFTQNQLLYVEAIRALNFFLPWLLLLIGSKVIRLRIRRRKLLPVY